MTDKMFDEHGSYNSSAQPVIQHINAESHPYRVPVFKLEPLDIQFSGQLSKKAKTVRLVSCDFSTNYYNVSPNNNCLRWLRKVKLDLNERVIEKFPENINAINPYFDGSYPGEEWHLCTLYINPSQYSDISSIVDEINNKLNESFKSLFNFSTSVERAYSGVQLNYGNYIFNSLGVINLTEALINNVSLSSNDFVSYIVDGEIIYTSNDVTNFGSNAILRIKNLDNATLTNAFILNPKFQQNQFTEYESNGNWFAHTSTLASLTNSGTDNIVREMNELKTECNVDLFMNVSGTIDDNFDIQNPKWHPVKYLDNPILINKASLKSFPDFIGLSSDENRRTFQQDKYVYRIKDENSDKYLNKDLRFDMDLNFNVKKTDMETYAEVKSGTVRAFSINCDLSSDRTKVSPIDYSGRILDDTLLKNKEKIPLTKIYYNDNSVNRTEYPFYNVTYKVLPSQDGVNPYVIEQYVSKNDKISVLQAITNNDNINVYIKTKKDVDMNNINYSYDVKSGNLLSFKLNDSDNGSIIEDETELIGYRMRKILDPYTKEENSVELIPNTNITPKQSDIRFEVLMKQEVNESIKLNQENLIIIDQNLVVKCDKNGNTKTMKNSVEYSDGSVYPNYYKVNVDISKNVIILKNGNKINALTTDTSDDLINTSFSKYIVKDQPGLSYAYSLNDDLNSKDYYEIFVDSYRINAEKVYVNKDIVSNNFNITTLVVTSDSVVESDSEGNLVKRYYYISNENKLIPIWEATPPIIQDNIRYSEGETELTHFRIIISDYDMKYVDTLVNNTNDNMNSGESANITSVVRKPVGNLYSKVSEIESVFTPLNSSAFKYDDIYYTNINNMVYLPFGALREIGSLNINYNTDNTSYSQEIDKTFIFNDVIDKNIVFTFKSDKISNKTKTEKLSKIGNRYLLTSAPLVSTKYTNKPYYVKNVKGEFVEIKSAAMKNNGNIKQPIVANIDNSFLNNDIIRDEETGGYVTSNANLFNKIQKFIAKSPEYEQTPIENANYYKYNDQYFYFDSSTRYEKTDNKIKDPNGDYLFYDKNVPDDTYPEFYPDGLVEFNRIDRFRKYWVYEKIDDNSVNGNYIYVGSKDNLNESTRDKFYIPVIADVNRFNKQVEYREKVSSGNENLLDGIIVVVTNPDGTAFNSENYYTVNNNNNNGNYKINGVDVHIKYMPTNQEIKVADTVFYLMKTTNVYVNDAEKITRIQGINENVTLPFGEENVVINKRNGKFVYDNKEVEIYISNYTLDNTGNETVVKGKEEKLNPNSVTGNSITLTNAKNTYKYVRYPYLSYDLNNKTFYQVNGEFVDVLISTGNTEPFVLNTDKITEDDSSSYEFTFDNNLGAYTTPLVKGKLYKFRLFGSSDEIRKTSLLLRKSSLYINYVTNDKYYASNSYKSAPAGSGDPNMYKYYDINRNDEYYEFDRSTSYFNKFKFMSNEIEPDNSYRNVWVNTNFVDLSSFDQNCVYYEGKYTSKYITLDILNNKAQYNNTIVDVKYSNNDELVNVTGKSILTLLKDDNGKFYLNDTREEVYIEMNGEPMISNVQCDLYDNTVEYDNSNLKLTINRTNANESISTFTFINVNDSQQKQRIESISSADEQSEENKNKVVFIQNNDKYYIDPRQPQSSSPELFTVDYVMQRESHPVIDTANNKVYSYKNDEVKYLKMVNEKFTYQDPVIYYVNNDLDKNDNGKFIQINNYISLHQPVTIYDETFNNEQEYVLKDFLVEYSDSQERCYIKIDNTFMEISKSIKLYGDRNCKLYYKKGNSYIELLENTDQSDYMYMNTFYNKMDDDTYEETKYIVYSKEVQVFRSEDRVPVTIAVDTVFKYTGSNGVFYNVQTSENVIIKYVQDGEIITPFVKKSLNVLVRNGKMYIDIMVPKEELKYYSMSDGKITSISESIPDFENGKTVLTLIDHKLQKVCYFNPVSDNSEYSFTSGKRMFMEEFDKTKNYDSVNCFISCTDCFIDSDNDKIYTQTNNLMEREVDGNYVGRYLATQDRSFGPFYDIFENMIRYTTNGMLFSNDSIDSDDLSENNIGIRYVYGIDIAQSKIYNILAYKYRSSPNAGDRIGVDSLGYSEQSFSKVMLKKIESFDEYIPSDIYPSISGTNIKCNSYYPNKVNDNCEKNTTLDYYLIKKPFETQSRKFILDNSSFKCNEYGQTGQWWIFDAIVSNNFNNVQTTTLDVSSDESNVKITIPQTHTDKSNDTTQTATLTMSSSISDITFNYDRTSNNYILKFVDSANENKIYTINGKKSDLLVSENNNYYLGNGEDTNYVNQNLMLNYPKNEIIILNGTSKYIFNPNAFYAYDYKKDATVESNIHCIDGKKVDFFKLNGLKINDDDITDETITVNTIEFTYMIYAAANNNNELINRAVIIEGADEFTEFMGTFTFDNDHYTNSGKSYNIFLVAEDGGKDTQISIASVTLVKTNKFTVNTNSTENIKIIAKLIENDSVFIGDILYKANPFNIYKASKLQKYNKFQIVSASVEVQSIETYIANVSSNSILYSSCIAVDRNQKYPNTYKPPVIALPTSDLSPINPTPLANEYYKYDQDGDDILILKGDDTLLEKCDRNGDVEMKWYVNNGKAYIDLEPNTFVDDTTSTNYYIMEMQPLFNDGVKRNYIENVLVNCTDLITGTNVQIDENRTLTRSIEIIASNNNLTFGSYNVNITDLNGTTGQVNDNRFTLGTDEGTEIEFVDSAIISNDGNYWKYNDINLIITLNVSEGNSIDLPIGYYFNNSIINISDTSGNIFLKESVDVIATENDKLIINNGINNNLGYNLYPTAFADSSLLGTYSNDIFIDEEYIQNRYDMKFSLDKHTSNSDINNYSIEYVYALESVNASTEEYYIKNKHDSPGYIKRFNQPLITIDKSDIYQLVKVEIDNEMKECCFKFNNYENTNVLVDPLLKDTQVNELKNMFNIILKRYDNHVLGTNVSIKNNPVLYPVLKYRYDNHIVKIIDPDTGSDLTDTLSKDNQTLSINVGYEENENKYTYTLLNSYNKIVTLQFEENNEFVPHVSTGSIDLVLAPVLAGNNTIKLVKKFYFSNKSITIKTKDNYLYIDGDQNSHVSLKCINGTIFEPEQSIKLNPDLETKTYVVSSDSSSYEGFNVIIEYVDNPTISAETVNISFDSDKNCFKSDQFYVIPSTLTGTMFPLVKNDLTLQRINWYTNDQFYYVSLFPYNENFLIDNSSYGYSNIYEYNQFINKKLISNENIRNKFEYYVMITNNLEFSNTNETVNAKIFTGIFGNYEYSWNNLFLSTNNATAKWYTIIKSKSNNDFTFNYYMITLSDGQHNGNVENKYIFNCTNTKLKSISDIQDTSELVLYNRLADDFKCEINSNGMLSFGGSILSIEPIPVNTNLLNISYDRTNKIFRCGDEEVNILGYDGRSDFIKLFNKSNYNWFAKNTIYNKAGDNEIYYQLVKINIEPVKLQIITNNMIPCDAYGSTDVENKTYFKFDIDDVINKEDVNNPMYTYNTYAEDGVVTTHELFIVPKSLITNNGNFSTYTYADFKYVNIENSDKYLSRTNYIQNSSGNFVKYITEATNFIYNNKQVKMSILNGSNSTQIYPTNPLIYPIVLRANENGWNYVIHHIYYDGINDPYNETVTVSLSYLDGTVITRETEGNDTLILGVDGNNNYDEIRGNVYKCTKVKSYVKDNEITSDFYIKSILEFNVDGMTNYVYQHINNFNDFSKLTWYIHEEGYKQNNNGNYIYVNTSLYPGAYLPFDGKNVFLRKMTYDVPMSADQETFARYIYINGTSGVGVNLEDDEHFFNDSIYYVEEFEDVVYNYINIDGRYIANVNISGESSVTENKFDINVNMELSGTSTLINDMFTRGVKDTFVITQNNDANIKFILNALSAKSKFMFRKDCFPTNVKLSGVSDGVNIEMNIIDYVNENTTDNPNILNYLAKCDISDTYIVNNGNVVNCLTLFKNGLYNKPESKSGDFPNIDNDINTLDVFFDLDTESPPIDQNDKDDVKMLYSPSTKFADKKSLVVFDYNRINKASNKNKLYPDLINNNIQYSIFDGSDDSPQSRHFTFYPYNGDFDDYECKNVEYVERSIGGNKYVHSYYTQTENGNSLQRGTYASDLYKNVIDAFEYKYSSASCNNTKEKCLYCHTVGDNTETNVKIIPVASNKDWFIPLDLFKKSNQILMPDTDESFNCNVFMIFKFLNKIPNTSSYIYIKSIDGSNSSVNSNPKYGNDVTFSNPLQVIDKSGRRVKIEKNGVQQIIITNSETAGRPIVTVDIIANVNGAIYRYVRAMDGNASVYSFTPDKYDDPRYNLQVYVKNGNNTYFGIDNKYTRYTGTRNSITSSKIDITSSIVNYRLISVNIIDDPSENINYMYPFIERCYAYSTLSEVDDTLILDESKESKIYRTSYIMKTTNLLSEINISEEDRNKISASNSPFCRIDFKCLYLKMDAEDKVNVKITNDNGNEDFEIVQTSDAQTIPNPGNTYWSINIIPLKKRSDMNVVSINVDTNKLYYDEKFTTKYVYGHYLEYNNGVINIFDNKENEQILNVEYSSEGKLYKKVADVNDLYKIGYSLNDVLGLYSLYRDEYIPVADESSFIGVLNPSNMRLLFSSGENFVPQPTHDVYEGYESIIRNEDMKAMYNKRYIKLLTPSVYSRENFADLSLISAIFIPVDSVKNYESTFDTTFDRYVFHARNTNKYACNVKYLNKSKSMKRSIFKVDVSKWNKVMFNIGNNEIDVDVLNVDEINIDNVTDDKITLKYSKEFSINGENIDKESFDSYIDMLRYNDIDNRYNDNKYNLLKYDDLPRVYSNDGMKFNKYELRLAKTSHERVFEIKDGDFLLRRLRIYEPTVLRCEYLRFGGRIFINGEEYDMDEIGAGIRINDPDYSADFDITVFQVYKYADAEAYTVFEDINYEPVTVTYNYTHTYNGEEINVMYPLIKQTVNGNEINMAPECDIEYNIQKNEGSTTISCDNIYLFYKNGDENVYLNDNEWVKYNGNLEINLSTENIGSDDVNVITLNIDSDISNVEFRKFGNQSINSILLSRDQMDKLTENYKLTNSKVNDKLVYSINCVRNGNNEVNCITLDSAIDVNLTEAFNAYISKVNEQLQYDVPVSYLRERNMERGNSDLESAIIDIIQKSGEDPSLYTINISNSDNESLNDDYVYYYYNYSAYKKDNEEDSPGGSIELFDKKEYYLIPQINFNIPITNNGKYKFTSINDNSGTNEGIIQFMDVNDNILSSTCTKDSTMFVLHDNLYNRGISDISVNDSGTMMRFNVDVNKEISIETKDIMVLPSDVQSSNVILYDQVYVSIYGTKLAKIIPNQQTFISEEVSNVYSVKINSTDNKEVMVWLFDKNKNPITLLPDQLNDKSLYKNYYAFLFNSNAVLFGECPQELNNENRIQLTSDSEIVNKVESSNLLVRKEYIEQFNSKYAHTDLIYDEVLFAEQYGLEESLKSGRFICFNNDDVMNKHIVISYEDGTLLSSSLTLYGEVSKCLYHINGKMYDKANDGLYQYGYQQNNNGNLYKFRNGHYLDGKTYNICFISDDELNNVNNIGDNTQLTYDFEDEYYRMNDNNQMHLIVRDNNWNMLSNANITIISKNDDYGYFNTNVGNVYIELYVEYTSDINVTKSEVNENYYEVGGYKYIIRDSEHDTTGLYPIVDLTNGTTLTYNPIKYVDLTDSSFKMTLSIYKYFYILPKSNANIIKSFETTKTDILDTSKVVSYAKKEVSEHGGKYVGNYNFVGFYAKLTTDNITKTQYLAYSKFRLVKQEFANSIIQEKAENIYTPLTKFNNSLGEIISYYRKYNNTNYVQLNSIQQENTIVPIADNIIDTQRIKDTSTKIDTSRKYFLRNLILNYASKSVTGDYQNIIFDRTNDKFTTTSVNTVTSLIEVYDTTNKLLGIGYNSKNNYEYDDYYTKNIFTTESLSTSNTWFDANVLNEFDLARKLNTNYLYKSDKPNVYTYKTKIRGYNDAAIYYTKVGLRQYYPNEKGGPIMKYNEDVSLSDLASGNKGNVIAYSVYSNKIDEREDLYNPTFALRQNTRFEDDPMLGLDSTSYCETSKIKPNIEIFPTSIHDVYDDSQKGAIISSSNDTIIVVKEGDYYLYNDVPVYLTEYTNATNEGKVIEMEGELVKLNSRGTHWLYTKENGDEYEVVIRNTGGKPWINKGFRIASSPDYDSELPNVFGLNIFDDSSKDFSTLTFYYKGNSFKVVTGDDNKGIPIFYTFMNSLCCSSGSLTSANINVEEGKRINNLIDDSGATEQNITKVEVNDNLELLYDKYYYDILNNIIFDSNNVNLLSDFGNPKIGLEFGFDAIPITSNPIFSNTENFLDVIEQPNFHIDNTTVKMPNIINYNKGKLTITNDNYKLNEYKKQNTFVDDYFYNFTIDDDLWKKLGFNPCKIEVDSKYMLNYNINGDIDVVIDESRINPVYLIKGKYYSEQIYTGPILAPRKYSFTDKQLISSGAKQQYKIKSYNIPVNANIKDAIDESAFNKYFMKSKHFAENMINLTIPKNVDVKITQNMDVEKYLNSNKIIDSLASVGTYGVIRPNDPAYDSIQQSININSTVTIPDNSSMYVFLTSSNQRYPIISSEATLNVEYIG